VSRPPTGADASRRDGSALPSGWPAGFAERGSERRAALVLTHLRGLAPRDLLRLAAREGSASAALRAVRRGAAGSENDREFARTAVLAELEAALRAARVRFVPVGDPDYPPALRDLADPPLALFARGRPLAADIPAVAIVGARSCTPYGEEVARSIGRGLAASGVTVVSGAARGIDAAAHRGALDGGGPTVAVLGSGPDVAYPRSSDALIGRIAAAGTVVSEYPPGTPAEPFRFPARNRIVAAMTRAVVVIEGALGSGSLITVDHAQDCGRDVFAVPGPVTGPLSLVPHELIRSGAPLVRDAADVLAELGLETSLPGVAGGGGADAGSAAGLSPADAAVLAALGSALAPETVAAAASVTLPETLAALLRLEVRGLVRQVGGRFERTLRAPAPAR
jgi:DNA processing protein